MKKQYLLFLGALLALARTPKGEDESEESVEAQKENLQLIRDEIDTMHGDEEFNDDEVKALIDDLIEVASQSEPDAEHAEIPELAVEGEKKKKKKKKGAKPAPEPAEDEDADEDEDAEPADEDEAEPADEAEAEPAEDADEDEDEDEEPAETPKARRLRLKAEADAAAAKKKKAALKKRH